MIPNRLPGHELWYEGAAHDDEGVCWSPKTTAGAGRAKCKCGELSPYLGSGAERKEWHRFHKQDEWMRRKGSPNELYDELVRAKEGHQ